MHTQVTPEDEAEIRAMLVVAVRQQDKPKIYFGPNRSLQIVAYSDTDVRERLADAVKKAGGQCKYAAQHGLSQPFLSECLAGKKSIPDDVSRSMGIRKVTVYIKEVDLDPYAWAR